MKTALIIIVVLAIVFCAVIALRRPSNPPFIIEIRNVANDDLASFEPQRYDEWAHSELIAGLRQRSQDTVYYCIYSDGLCYCFSHSGRVYAMAPNENFLPMIFIRDWTWSGDPHKFPHFDFSKTYHQIVQDG